jgi:hypothetical protein
VKPHNTPRILGRKGGHENMTVFITAVLATYVTAQEKPSFLTEENRTQNVSNIPTSKEAKPVGKMHSFFCTKISKLSHCMNKIRN